LEAASESTGNALLGTSGAEEIAAPTASMQTSSLLAAGSGVSEDSPSLESASDEQIERELMKEAHMTDVGGRKIAVMKKRLVDKARKDPEVVSQLIRTMLRERI
jgi:methyl coenzyme M reductase subunit C